MNLETFNAATDEDALSLAMHFCGARAWAESLVAARPFPSLAALKHSAASIWDASADDTRLEAFAAHPLIGDVDLLREKYANTARAEQGQVLDAEADVIQALANQNRAYLDRHGFIFIICASGKSAAEMLASLEARIDNDTATEIANASREQAAITALRIDQTLGTTC